MALSKLFQRIFWHNNTTPAINEDNLNAMSKAIDDIDDRVIDLGDDVLEKVPIIIEKYDDIVALSENPPYIGTNGNWYVWNIEQGDYIDSGIDASITLTIADVTMLAYGQNPYVTNTGTNTDPIFHLYIPRASGISNVEKTSTSGLVDTYTITFEDGTTKTFTISNGKSISSVTKTASSGLVDTYTIAYNDNTTSTFTITNGNGISKIEEYGVHTSGGRTIITYEITFTNGTTFLFDVTDGKDGATGATPSISATATADATSSTTPTVQVTKSGTDAAPSFAFAFSGLKGAKGDKGDKGDAGTTEWSGINNKPFDSVGNGLTVSNNVLAANVQSVNLARLGTASATVTSYQKLQVNGSAVGAVITGSMYLQSSSKTTADGVDTFTFTNSNITSSADYDVSANVFGVVPTDMVQSGTTMQVKFKSSDNVTSCRLYIK